MSDGRIHGTTVLAVRRDGMVAMAADGQITVGDVVMKHTARKIRRLYHDRVLGGFAGSVADAITLFERFESRLEQHAGNLKKSSVELTKDWRTDRYLRRLEAFLLVADAKDMLVLSGDGEVIEPDGGVVAIGSGGSYAQAAATALLAHSSLSAAEIARTSLEIAASLCIYTNNAITVDVLEP
ncbi:MAG TPA: ATP-dependent protease subunit HslV [Chloroflexota bacterium]|nr:ATP-dependent protease subunit HslV [Chloroflexota bacterium]